MTCENTITPVRTTCTVEQSYYTGPLFPVGTPEPGNRMLLKPTKALVLARTVKDEEDDLTMKEVFFAMAMTNSFAHPVHVTHDSIIEYLRTMAGPNLELSGSALLRLQTASTPYLFLKYKKVLRRAEFRTPWGQFFAIHILKPMLKKMFPGVEIKHSAQKTVRQVSPSAPTLEHILQVASVAKFGSAYSEVTNGSLAGKVQPDISDLEEVQASLVSLMCDVAANAQRLKHIYVMHQLSVYHPTLATGLKLSSELKNLIGSTFPLQFYGVLPELTDELYSAELIQYVTTEMRNASQSRFVTQYDVIGAEIAAAINQSDVVKSVSIREFYPTFGLRQEVDGDKGSCSVGYVGWMAPFIMDDPLSSAHFVSSAENGAPKIFVKHKPVIDGVEAFTTEKLATQALALSRISFNGQITKLIPPDAAYEFDFYSGKGCTNTFENTYGLALNTLEYCDPTVYKVILALSLDLFYFSPFNLARASEVAAAQSLDASDIIPGITCGFIAPNIKYLVPNRVPSETPSFIDDMTAALLANLIVKASVAPAVLAPVMQISNSVLPFVDGQTAVTMRITSDPVYYGQDSEFMTTLQKLGYNMPTTIGTNGKQTTPWKSVYEAIFLKELQRIRDAASHTYMQYGSRLLKDYDVKIAEIFNTFLNSMHMRIFQNSVCSTSCLSASELVKLETAERVDRMRQMFDLSLTKNRYIINDDLSAELVDAFVDVLLHAAEINPPESWDYIDAPLDVNLVTSIEVEF